MLFSLVKSAKNVVLELFYTLSADSITQHEPKAPAVWERDGSVWPFC